MFNGKWILLFNMCMYHSLSLPPFFSLYYILLYYYYFWCTGILVQSFLLGKKLCKYKAQERTVSVHSLSLWSSAGCLIHMFNLLKTFLLNEEMKEWMAEMNEGWMMGKWLSEKNRWIPYCILETIQFKYQWWKHYCRSGFLRSKLWDKDKVY